jgi:toxin ParE1/3/4
MASHILRRPQVRREVVDLADHTSHDSFEVAIRFLEAVERTFEFLATNREVGQVCGFANPSATGLRVWPVDGFRNHLVFYRATADGVEIVRVLHGARDFEVLFGEDE